MNKIAIIEDDIDICNMIAKFLENNKYIVHYALNGAEGIELCKSLVPDLIILDIMLPKLNGNDRRYGLPVLHSVHSARYALRFLLCQAESETKHL